jgi:hypothetical protein
MEIENLAHLDPVTEIIKERGFMEITDLLKAMLCPNYY